MIIWSAFILEVKMKGLGVLFCFPAHRKALPDSHEMKRLSALIHWNRLISDSLCGMRDNKMWSK